jgi:transposase InsO family protein
MSTTKQDLALWRYGIISSLLHRDANEESLTDLLRQLSSRIYIRPDGSQLSISAETIRKWLYRYLKGGLPALEDQDRSDKGSHHVPEELIEAMFAIRAEHPRWTLSRLIEELVSRGSWDGRAPARSTLYRLANERNLMRDPHQANNSDARSFAFSSFGQLWTADFLHGPKLREARNRYKTFLHAIIDDCSRYIVSAAFYRSEGVETLMSELMLSIRRFGIPQRFYTDNGPCYASRHLKIVTARLGIQLVHTPPYRPQGRGKIERFFRTVRDHFLVDHYSGSLEEINRDLQEWLSRYHGQIHSSLKCSPLEKRLTSKNVCRKLPEVADTSALFRMERRLKVFNNSTISLFGKSFEVSGCLPGERITAYYLPWDLSQVYYGQDMSIARPVDLFANARRFELPGSSLRKGEPS